MSNELSSMANIMLPQLENEMQAVLHFDGSKTDLFRGMMHYQMGWIDEQLQPIEPISGKRIRPLVCMLVCDASGGEWQQAVPAASGIEILHNFSLVHDDIEDVSPTRRGRPTIWKLWGEAQAINCGDAMFSQSHTAVGNLINTGTPPATVVKAMQLFDKTCFQLTEGQHRDMNFETRDDVSVDEYLEMITGKTAVLISYSTAVGAMVAGAPQETIDHYAAYGLNVGLAFQVIDDILGIWGEESRTGKSAATDIITKKKTLPVLFGLENCEPLRDIYREREADADFVRDVVQLLNDVGAREFADERAEEYSTAAIEHLTVAQPEGDSGKA
ncbi:MAG: polyprenyl synthetase family protein [Candidatus Promineifilaceae bacterium]